MVSFWVGEVAGWLCIGPLAEIEVGADAEVLGHVWECVNVEGSWCE